MSNLITVPTFTFNQGDVFDGAEMPIQVCYYSGNNGQAMIELNQEGRYINFTSVEEVKRIVKLIQKHLPEAEKRLGS